MASSRRPDRLVVDANPIISALLGGGARRVFFEAGVREFAVVQPVLDDVSRYLPSLAEKLDVSPSFLQYALDLLPLETYSARTYTRTLGEAGRRIGQRDPSDIEVLALALRLDLPVWSNDRDFESAQIEVFTTAQLLAAFFGRR